MKSLQVFAVVLLTSLLAACHKEKDNTGPTTVYNGLKTIEARFRSNPYNDSTYNGTLLHYTFRYNGKQISTVVPEEDPDHYGVIHLWYKGNNLQSIGRLMRKPSGDTLMYDSLRLTYKNDKIDSLQHYQRYSNIPGETEYYSFRLVYTGNNLAGLMLDTFLSYDISNTGADVTRVASHNSYNYIYQYDITNLKNNLGSSVPIWLIMYMIQSNIEPVYTYHLYMNPDLVNCRRNSLNQDDRYNYSYSLLNDRITKRIAENVAAGYKDTVIYNY